MTTGLTFMWKDWKQVPGFKVLGGILLVAFLVVLSSHKLRFGVYQTYLQGADDIVSHANPYPQQPQEFHSGFKYSPLFGVLFFPFKMLPLKEGSFVWRFLNLSVFLAGLTFFLSFLFKNRGGISGLITRPYQLLLLLVLTYTPLIISLKVAQANPLVCGLVLMGLAFYGQGRDDWAGGVLAVACNFKVFPLVFAGLLFLDCRWSYWKSFLGTSFLSLLLPAVFLGWTWNWELHILWVQVLLADFDTHDKLSVWQFLQHNFGFNSAGIYRLLVFINVIFLCVVYRKACSGTKPAGLKLLYPLGALFVLLFNHRTETELFVLVNPVYALLFLSILEKRRGGQSAIQEIVFLVAGHFFISLAHSDLVPDAVTEWLEQFKVRVLGALILYIYYLMEGIKAFLRNRAAV